MFPSTTSLAMNQGMVEDQGRMVASQTGYYSQASHLPHLNLPAYGYQQSLGGALVSNTSAHLRGGLPSGPPNAGDAACGGAGSGQFGAPQAQRSSVHPWYWVEEGGSGSKRPSAGEEQHGSENNNNNRHTSTSHTMHNNGLSIATIRMKKAKARRKVREPRFCFKTMSDVDVLDDGYKWRKYGQKVVKNTQHPRSYYRCTQDNCRVKKRVERLAEDPRMVITTYEGRHAHSPSHDGDESKPPSHINFFW